MENKEQTNACYGCFGAANGDCDECARIGVINSETEYRHTLESCGNPAEPKRTLC